MTWVALVNQPKEGEQLAPAAAPLVHGVRIERGVLEEARIEAAQRVARLIDLTRSAVGARGQEVAVFSVQDEHELHQDREQTLVEMAGPLARDFADEIGRGGVETAQQLVQGAQHLLSECSGHSRLRLAAFLQEGGKSAVVGVVEQSIGIEQQLQPAEHRPARNRGERTQRECQIAGRLAARRIDKAQFRQIAIAALLAVVALGDHQAGEDATLAQQPLEALVRRRLPSGNRTARVRIDAGRLYAHQQLPGLTRGSGPAQLLDRPSGLKRRVVLRQTDGELGRDPRSASYSGDMLRVPAEHRLHERPRQGSRRTGRLKSSCLPPSPYNSSATFAVSA